MTATIHLVVCLGMLVVIPLGLRLLGVPRVRYWWIAAVPGAASLWLDRGWLPTAMAAVYFAGTLALVAVAVDLVRRQPTTDPVCRQPTPGLVRRATAPGLVRRATAPGLVRRATALRFVRRVTALRFVRRVTALRFVRRVTARDFALATALVMPSVAGLSLVAERAGYELFGFKLTVLSLTVAHFHFAGFAAALIAGLVATASPGRDASLAAISVPVGTGIVLIGFFLGDWVELLGAAVLTTGMWLVGWVLWRRTRATTGDRITRTLLVVAAGVLVVTMLLALSWALGHTAGTPHLSLGWMVATHGVANAFGFALCGLLAWHRLSRLAPGVMLPTTVDRVRSAHTRCEAPHEVPGGLGQRPPGDVPHPPGDVPRPTGHVPHLTGDGPAPRRGTGGREGTL